jgi:hypothetical protein
MTSAGRTGIFSGLVLMTVVAMHQEDSVRVCVGSDRVLRVLSGTRCPSGQTEYVLAQVTPKLDDAPRPGEQAARDPNVMALKRQLETLSARVAELQSDLQAADRARGEKVRAPFEVVDAAGRTIMRVRAEGPARGIEMFTETGQAVAWMSAIPGGGIFKAQNLAATYEIVAGATATFAAFTLRQGDVPRAALAVTNGYPSLELTNNGRSVAALSVVRSGSGYLQLGNPDGSSIVEAGMTVKGCGLVRSFPTGNPGAGLVGMPGTFILGRC